MNPTTTSVADLDEASLRRLAREPARPLVPLLNQARAMRPLIALFAVIPPLMAASQTALNARNAWQGLAALNVLQAQSSRMFLDPAQSTALDGQPPLASWLTALAMATLGSDSTAPLTFVGCLGVAVLVLATAMAARRLRGDRAAFLASAWVTLQPLLLIQPLQPGPAPLGAGLAALALVGLAEHWQRGAVFRSWPLLWGGVALGACSLTTPLVAGAAMAAATAAVAAGVVWRVQSVRDSSGLSDASPVERLAGVLAWMLLGAVVGGWWSVWKLASPGPHSFWESLSLVESLDLFGVRGPGNGWSGWQKPGWLFLASWPLWGLVGLGTRGLLSPPVQKRRPIRPGSRALASVGLAASLVAALIGTLETTPLTTGFASLQLLALVAPTALAAMGCLRIIDRQTEPGEMHWALWGAFVAGLGTLIVLWTVRPGDSSPGRLVTGLGVAAVGAWIVVSMSLSRKLEEQPQDQPRRWQLGVGLCLLLACQASWAWSAGTVSSPIDRELRELRDGLRRLESQAMDKDTEVHLASADSGAPVELRFLVRALWPTATAPEVESATTFQGPSSRNEQERQQILITWVPPNSRPWIPAADRWKSRGLAIKFRGGEVVPYERLPPAK